ncbi:MAG: Uncharacterised protein [Oceanospirillaceae bacterium UBA2001]|nr:MAG: Uncharacterised protein [Oceanospirillaceae bacterium UBA2001]
MGLFALELTGMATVELNTAAAGDAVVTDPLG